MSRCNLIYDFVLDFYIYSPHPIRQTDSLTERHKKWTLLFLIIQNRNVLFQNRVVQLDDVKQQEVIQKLLWNVYQAFEAKQEEKVYDQLSLSVSGNLHETLYLQNRRALILNDGAWSKINSVEIRRLTGNPSPEISESYLYDCEWSVIGEVIHWGHQHRRENLYRAAIKIAPVDGIWKIIELQSLGQQRV